MGKIIKINPNKSYDIYVLSNEYSGLRKTKKKVWTYSNTIGGMGYDRYAIKIVERTH